jgi:hypothetical protein
VLGHAQQPESLDVIEPIVDIDGESVTVSMVPMEADEDRPAPSDALQFSQVAFAHLRRVIW